MKSATRDCINSPAIHSSPVQSSYVELAGWAWQKASAKSMYALHLLRRRCPGGTTEVPKSVASAAMSGAMSEAMSVMISLVMSAAMPDPMYAAMSVAMAWAMEVAISQISAGISESVKAWQSFATAARTNSRSASVSSGAAL